MKTLLIQTLLLGVLVLGACNNSGTQSNSTGDTTTPPSSATDSATNTTTAPSSTAPSEWIVYNANGETLLFGNPVEFDDLSVLLQDTLSKMDIIPDEIPVKFVGEVLMGARGAIRDEIQEAIDAAKAAKAKK
jgi:hypothetical protein